jgi:hypothetical protein
MQTIPNLQYVYSDAKSTSYSYFQLHLQTLPKSGSYRYMRALNPDLSAEAGSSKSWEKALLDVTPTYSKTFSEQNFAEIFFSKKSPEIFQVPNRNLTKNHLMYLYITMYLRNNNMKVI